MSLKISFLKKNFISKEKYGAVIVNISYENSEIKKTKFYFGTLVLASYCYCGGNAQNTDFFQTLASKKEATWRFKKTSD